MGLNREKPALDPLAVQHLNNRLYIIGEIWRKQNCGNKIGVLDLSDREFLKYQSYYCAEWMSLFGGNNSGTSKPNCLTNFEI